MARAKRSVARLRRHARVRQKIFGTAARPRLNVYRSSEHIYAQVIDDETGHTLVSASTIDRELQDKASGLTKMEQAKLVGELVAQRALAAGIATIVFDRGGYPYSGRVKSLAEASREAGLQF